MLRREYPDEWREHLSESKKKYYSNHKSPFYGKRHTVENKNLVSRLNTKHHVLQLDSSTKKVIQRFENSQTAGNWIVEHGLSSAKSTTCSGRIFKVCSKNNLNYVAYGYSWCFEEGQSTNL